MSAKKKIDNYEIFLDKMLGEGSFGKVYQGQQDTTGKKVAVKMLDKRLVDKDDYIKKALFEEIKILALLKSDYIVGFFDVMESANYYYLVQEFCDGGDLRALMDKRGVLSEAEALGLFKQICSGFVSMLKEGIIHRDLKPENIMIHNNAIKIGDFGFSKRLDNKRFKNGTVVGTPLYMSLQILKSEPYTGKCDIWALGLIFYEILHGTTAWIAKSEYELIQNIQNKPLKINSKLSDHTRSCIEAMLKLDEKDRISWDSLLRHPVFQGHFHEYINMNQSFEDKMKSVMNELRYVIKSSNIDLERLFANLGYSKDSELTLDNLRKLFQVIGSKVSLEECRYVFEKIDTDDSNTISLSELQVVLTSYQIPMKSVAVPNFAKKISMDSSGQQNGTTQGLETRNAVQQKLVTAFKKLDEKMTKNSLSLQQVYDAYDVDKSGDMTLKEFARIIKKLDDSLSDEEVKTAFLVIDTSENRSISFEEFNRYFCKCVGVAYYAQRS